MMNGKVLVLNQDYSPLTICSVNRAFLLVFLDKAQLLESDENSPIRTVNDEYPKPSVIRINRYISVPYRGVVLSRQNLFKRDGNRCQYCGSERDLTVDHLIPRSRGGKSVWKNLVTACQSCNARKGDKTPETMGMRLIRAPFKPTYLTFLRNSIGEMREEWQNYLKASRVA